MQMPPPRGNGRDAASYLLLMLAGSGLCVGLFSGIVLFRIRNNAINTPQPYIATASDFDAEKRMQRRKIGELRANAEPDYPGSLAAILPPPPDSDKTKPDRPQSTDDKSEAPKTSAPDAAPRSREQPPPAEQRPQQRLSARRMERQAAPSSSTLPPSRPATPDAPRRQDPSDELTRIRLDLRDLAMQAVAVKDNNKLLFEHLAEEIGALHIELRSVGSRIAVAEYAIKQNQEGGLLSWLTALGTVVAVLQGLAIAYEFVRDRRWKWRARVVG